MNFATSSQRKSWIFSEESLAACRDKASRGSNDGAHSSRVQKFASGFHARQVVDTCGNADTSCTNVSSATTKTDTKGPILSIRDQETLVQFHAHQIQTLVGPYALLPELRRSQKVLSTAIALFRRFFLSNSVIECNPRKIAAAAALFAAKSEEEKIEISLLAHATSIVQRKVRHAPLCRTELGAMSITQIEEGERELMEGLNYEFMCHHACGLTESLVTDVTEFFREQTNPSRGLDICDPQVSCGEDDDDDDTSNNARSPRSVTHSGGPTPYEPADEEAMEVAMDAMNQTLIFSDATFLFSPEAIAYAIVSIATESFRADGHMSDDMQNYLITRHPFKTEDEILTFSREVGSVVVSLLRCQEMDLLPGKRRSGAVIAQRAQVLRRVLVQVADIRLLTELHQVGHLASTRRRKRHRSYGYSPAYHSATVATGTQAPQHGYRKMAKVTPTTGY